MVNSVQISCTINQAVSFAMQQNHVPVVRQLTIKNISEAKIHNLTVTITSDPDIADEWSAKIDSLLPEQEHLLNVVDLRLSASRLYEMTERINGALSIIVSDEAGVLAVEKYDLSFLSYDEWSGADTSPEFLTAFITPNHAYVTELIKKAGVLLAKWTESPSFTGYQSKNPNNVKKQMAAVYGALQQENISYSMPPASFEENGQKIRLSGTIKEQKLGTCMDLALLYAGCLEAAGLHAMIVLVKGHAFAGCWLEKESFAECVQDDVSLLTKRIAPGINEICVVETTACTAGESANFEDAVSAAEALLRKQDDFIYLVDVKRSRGSGIRPIPQRKADGSFSFDEYEPVNKVHVTTAPDDLVLYGKLQYTDAIHFSKQQMWERKLLDLSLRNTLLNFRVTRNAIQLFVNSVHDLEDALSGGEEFQIMHRPLDMENSPRDNKIYEGVHHESIWSTLIKSEFQHHRIRTYLDEAFLGVAVSALYRSARTTMEENGANTLYLALGFLKWYENIVSEKPLYAPLILIPVDIIRKSAQRGYVFRLRDEEPQFNITLLEMLRMNFGMNVTGLDPLPADEQGVDIRRVFHIIRQLIMDKPRWDVEELAFIGIFSFTRFIMWNDIRNRTEDLKRNKIVSSLISGQMEWESPIAFPSPEELDDTVTPADLAVPISADSSQLASVYAAGKGNSFVLHGPPGTGKSQTITNIIANALYQGKSVLFVAEKMAALTVVQKRLNAIGLSDFCLELHSNKARKKDVLNQLEKTLQAGRIKPPQQYREEADAIFALRMELNGIVRELHKSRSFGFSLYEAISRAEQYADYPGCMSFSGEQIASLTPQKYAHWMDLCGMLSTAGMSCGGVHAHALREYKNAQFNQSERIDTEAKLHEYSDILSTLASSATQISDSFRLGKIMTFAQQKALSHICDSLADGIRIPSAVFLCQDLPLYKEKITAVCASGIRRDTIKAEICTVFSEQLLTFNADTALLEWDQAEMSWFIPKITGKSRIIRAVRLYALDKKNYDKSATIPYLRLVSEYQKLNAVVRDSAAMLTQLFGILFNNGNCDWPLIERITHLAVDLRKSVQMAAENEASQDTAFQYLSESLDHNTERFITSNKPAWLKHSSLMARLSELETALSEKFNNPFAQWQDEVDWMGAMSEKTSRWIAGFTGLHDYCAYLRVKSELEAEGLHTVYTALEHGAVTETNLTGALIKNLSDSCAQHIIDHTPSLNAFHGSLFTQKIEKLKALHGQYEMLTKQELAARLSAQIPVLSTGVSGSSEIGILQRAIRSGGRMMPVRKLFESIPHLLRMLCPCMLMSPISVAQYLDPKHPPFDLVIFDEASQLPTCEAVGAIARGNELIVVGDPKQLPPTSFFSSNQADEDNYEREDLESVLDDCLALSMPQEHLLWHYRSRHESLIAFSNRMFYQNRLFTFPSPNDRVSQVRLIPVEGFYDRGRTKQNKAEAEAITQEIIRRLSDPILRNRSIGVVTFNAVQQNLITDMLDAEFNRHPHLDEMANNAEEPIFIKNLENVQGDERDVILFSVGYGPDEQGRVALNFGPLNREGGWRRLNVAVSRARYEMLIFSVLKPEQIDLNRTRSDGLAGLKSFLEFAARGINVLPGADRPIADLSDLVRTIAKEIQALGYMAHINIGCSGYQVDIGVVDPENPDVYILGILCDSKNYYHGGTAIDRNHIQQAALQGLGWNVSRVWILDWWVNREKELNRIKTDIETAIKMGKKDRGLQNELTKPAEPQVPWFEKADVSSETALQHYIITPLEGAVVNAGNSDYFTGYESTGRIRRQIEAVLAAEAPIHRELLCRRVLEAWGISRMGARINKRFDGLFSALDIQNTQWRDHTFYWNAAQDPLHYDAFRIPSPNDKSRRNMEHIPPEEVASAMKYILSQQIGLLREDLERETARIFGFSRCTEAMQKYMRTGVEIALQREWAVVDGDRIISNRMSAGKNS